MPKLFGYGIFAMLCNLLWLHSLAMYWADSGGVPGAADPRAVASSSSSSAVEASSQQRRTEVADDQQRQILRLEQQLSAVVEQLETTKSSDPKNKRKHSNNHKRPSKQTRKQSQSKSKPRSEEIDEKANSKSMKEKSLSACLLIKDDNDLLNEWLAYHTHALHLRYLVVAVDPSSVTSPSEIFSRWRNLTNIEIIEWSDPDFMPREFMEKGYHIHPSKLTRDAKESQWHEGHEDPEQVVRDNLVVANHRFRQVTFLSNCLRHMRDHKKTYVAHIDTDEFIVLNPLMRRRVSTTTTSTARDKAVQSLVDYAVNARVHEPRTVFRALDDYIASNRVLRQKVSYPCISMPRLLFGSKERNETETTTAMSSSSTNNSTASSPIFNTTLFETLRWRYHTSFDDIDRNAQPKVIVDVSQVDAGDRMFANPFSIHRPSMDLCRPMDKLNFRELGRFPVTVNHYVGSWERYYLSKNDTRRSERAYQFKANVSVGHDDWLEGWLDGFVLAQGADKAQQLLKDYVLGV